MRSQETGVRSQESGVGKRQLGPNRRLLDSGFWILDSRRHRAAFTLLELLTVIAIIAILAGLTVAGASYGRKKARISRAQAEIASLEGALENYKIDTGRYPLSTTTRICPTCASNNSALLYQALSPNSGKGYFSFKTDQIKGQGITDAFGDFYNYYCNPGAADQTNQVTFDLWSYGTDGQNDTADDITNWR